MIDLINWSSKVRCDATLTGDHGHMVCPGTFYGTPTEATVYGWTTTTVNNEPTHLCPAHTHLATENQ